MKGYWASMQHVEVSIAPGPSTMRCFTDRDSIESGTTEDRHADVAVLVWVLLLMVVSKNGIRSR